MNRLYEWIIISKTNFSHKRDLGRALWAGWLNGYHFYCFAPLSSSVKKNFKCTSVVRQIWIPITALKSNQERASLVAQWLRICLPVQGTRVRALVWEDPTCRGATGPVSHNY